VNLEEEAQKFHRLAQAAQRAEAACKARARHSREINKHTTPDSLAQEHFAAHTATRKAAEDIFEGDA
jgi:hypothetical protein